MKGREKYAVRGGPVQLDVPDGPECQVSESDNVEWKKLDQIRLAKWKKIPTYYSDCSSTVPDKCTLHQNGTLYLRGPNSETTSYTVNVYNSSGYPKCSGTVTVIVEDEVTAPVVSHNCTSSGALLRCSAPGIGSELTLSYGAKSQTTQEESITLTIKERKVEVTCVTRNRVSERSATLTVTCTGWDLVLIASVAGGAVALIIFIILVIYSVKYKPWRSHSREEVEINEPQPSTLQRQVQTPGPTGHRSGCGDFTERGESVLKPPTPHRPEPHEPAPGGRSGKQTKNRRAPPQAPEETAPMYPTALAPQQTRPNLPGNHPSEQAPRPQPRTKSKPPRQNRKN